MNINDLINPLNFKSDPCMFNVLVILNNELERLERKIDSNDKTLSILIDNMDSSNTNYDRIVDHVDSLATEITNFKENFYG